MMKILGRFLLIISIFATMILAKYDFQLYPQQVKQTNTSFLFKIKNAKIPNNILGTFTHKKILTCNNGLEGAIGFFAEDTLILHPSKPFVRGQKYICQTNPKYVTKNSKITFTSKPFNLKNIKIFETDIVSLTFNDIVLKEDFLKNISFYKKDKLNKSKINYAIQSEDGKTYAIKLSESPNKFTIKIDKNLHSYANIPIKEEFEILHTKDYIAPKYNKYTKTEIIYDKPRFNTIENGNIVLNIFTRNYHSQSGNLQDFIKIEKLQAQDANKTHTLKEFSINESRRVSYNMEKKFHLNNKTRYYNQVSAKFLPHTTYKITLKNGFGDKYYQLDKDVVYTIKTGNYGSYVSFDNTDKPYLSNAGYIGITSVNVNSISINIRKILDNNFRYFVNFDGTPFENMTEELVTKKFTLNNPKNNYTTQKISLVEATKGLKSGAYSIDIYYDRDKKTSKIVYLSDIGLSAKLYKDGIFVSASSLKNTSSLALADVTVYSSSNKILAQGKTQQDGTWQYEKKDFIKENPHSIIVSKGNEQNFLLLTNSLNKTELFKKNNSLDEYNAFIYFQSKLIRPNENLFAFIVIKDRKFHSLKNAPVVITVKDPKSKVVYKKNFTTDEKGIVRVVVPLQNQKTGQYSFNLFLANRIKASQNFLIEAFLPQKIKNDIKIAKTTYRANEILEVGVHSNYLFGAPASKLRGVLQLRAIPKEYKNKTYPTYTFIDKIKDKKDKINFIDTKKNLVLDNNGTSNVLIATDIRKKPSSILNGQLEFAVLDDGRKVSTYKNIDIYPYKRMVGVKIKDKMVDEATPINIKTLLIDPVTNKIQDGPLEVGIYKKKWHYYYNNSHHQYKWQEEMQLVFKTSIKAGKTFTKIFNKSGQYVAVFYDALHGHSASVNFHVRGWDYEALEPTSDIAKNQVTVQKKLYKKGDIVQADIKTPMKEGRILVALEGEKVYWHKIVDFKNAHIQVDIPINIAPKEGLFLTTHAIRSSDTPSTITPFRSLSSTLLKADQSEKNLDVIIDTNDRVRSNTSFPVTVKTKANSKVIISLVDDGILQILGQKPPKPFDFFARNPKKLIANYDMYDLLMHYLVKGKLLSFGSGVAESMIQKKHLSPKTNAKRVKPFVYFSKILTSDAKGNASINIQTPQSFNGSATVVAIAVDDEGIGANSKKIIIKDEVIIKPIYPRYGTIGDEWNIPVRIFNTTANKIVLNLENNTSNNIEIVKLNKTLELAPNSSQLLHVNIKIKGFGKGKITLKANALNHSFTHSVELPLIYPYPLKTYVKQGETKDEITLSAPKQYLHGNFTLNISGDVFANLRNNMDYMISYPYGCAEQTSSKILALLHLENFINPENKDEEQAKLKDRLKFINEGINKLGSLQNSNGSFSYWKSDDYVNDFASIYSTDVLLNLQEDGFEVHDFIIAKALRSLKKYAFSQSHTNHFLQLYASYLLATKNIVDISSINFLYDNKFYQGTLPSRYMMAYLLKKAKMDSEMGAVLNQIKKFNINSLSKQRSYDNTFYSYQRDLAFALYLHVKHFTKDATSQKLFDKVKKEFSNLYSTQDNAFAIRAINEYYKGYKKGVNKFAVKAENINEEYEYDALIQKTLIKNNFTITPKNNWVNYSLSVSKYLPLNTKHQKVEQGQKNINIYRDFTDENGKILDLSHLKVGQNIFSKIEILSREDIKNIVINEQIPSCFEIINERIYPKIRTQKVKNSTNFKADYQDIRDDKVLTFLSLKANKKVIFFTPLNVTSKGTCNLPAVLSEAMYDERISDYDLSKNSITVE